MAKCTVEAVTGFPKKWGTLLGVPIIRTRVFVVYIGVPHISGNYEISVNIPILDSLLCLEKHSAALFLPL